MCRVLLLRKFQATSSALSLHYLRMTAGLICNQNDGKQEERRLDDVGHFQ